MFKEFWINWYSTLNPFQLNLYPIRKKVFLSEFNLIFLWNVTLFLEVSAVQPVSKNMLTGENQHPFTYKNEKGTVIMIDDVEEPSNKAKVNKWTKTLMC